MRNSNQIFTSAQKQRTSDVSIYLICIVALSSCYGNLNTATQMAQYIPAAGSISLALLLFVTGKVKHLQKSATKSILAGAAITLLALIGSTISQDVQSSLYALVFFLTWLSLVVILQYYTMPQILRSFAYGGVLSVFLYLMLSGFKIEGALSATGNAITIEDRSSGPYLTHPNLIAHIMAVFAILAVLLAPSEKTSVKIIFYVTAIIAFLIILSTSSRGGLVALVCALSIGIFITYRGNIKYLLCIFFAVIAACTYITLFQSEYIDRLSLIMDLNSAQRGLDSGLSGRQELWQMVFYQFFTSNIPFLWGGGFRNTWLSTYISAVDNGYIVAIAEAGFISLLIILSRLIFVAIKSTKRLKNSPNTMDAAIVGLVAFILIESIIARYLLAIGNPASLIILILIVAGPKGYIIFKKVRQ